MLLEQFAVALVEHRFAKAGVDLRQEIDGALPAVVGDPRLLEHAVVNLLLNACDACRAGGDVLIRGRRDQAEIEILVEDSGAGISPSDVGRALEPFFTTKGPKSTGLGLSVAYGTIQRYGGTLSIDSAEGLGATVAVSLPAGPSVSDAHGASRSAGAGSRWGAPVAAAPGSGQPLLRA